MDPSNRQAKAIGAHIAAAFWVTAAVALVGAIWWLWAVYGVRIVYRAIFPAAAGASPPGVADLGQVGDLFGGVNALFAAIAVVGVFWAGYLQRQALIETRQALQEERAANERQQFEATLFQLIALFRSLLENTQIEANTGLLPGPSALSVDGAVSRIMGDRAIAANFYWSSSDSQPEALGWHSGVAHAEIFRENETQLGPLFRMLAAVLDHVDGLREAHPDDATRYAGIVQAQLSTALLTLFAFHSVPENDERTRALIERFQLLSPLTKDSYLHWVLSGAFSAQAFGGQSPSGGTVWAPEGHSP